MKRSPAKSLSTSSSPSPLKKANVDGTPVPTDEEVVAPASAPVLVDIDHFDQDAYEDEPEGDWHTLEGFIEWMMYLLPEVDEKYHASIIGRLKALRRDVPKFSDVDSPFKYIVFYVNDFNATEEDSGYRLYSISKLVEIGGLHWVLFAQNFNGHVLDYGHTEYWHKTPVDDSKYNLWAGDGYEAPFTPNDLGCPDVAAQIITIMATTGN